MEELILTAFILWPVHVVTNDYMIHQSRADALALPESVVPYFFRDENRLE